MFPYLALTFGALSSRFLLPRQEKYRHINYALLLLALFVFCAFRYEVGCDWLGYEYQWINVSARYNDAFSGYNDLLWWISMKTLSDFGLPFNSINVFSAAVFFFGLHSFARKQLDPIGFLVLCFPVLILNMPMSALRQAVAIGIIFFAYRAFIRGQTLRYAGLVLFAAMFHTSAAILIFLTPFVRGELKLRYILPSAIFGLAGAVLLLQSVDTLVDRYVEADTEAFGAVYRVGALAATGAIYLIFLRKPWRAKWPADYALVTVGSACMVADLFLLLFSTVVADRIGYYLIPIQILICIKAYRLFREQYQLAAFLAPYIALYSLMLVWFAASSLFVQCYTPYRTWLFG